MGLFDKAKPAAAGGGAITRLTSRSDWEQLVPEIYSRVIAGNHLGIGVLTVKKSMMSKTVNFRLNQEFSGSGVIEYIRRKFQPGHFDQFFSGGAGLAVDQSRKLYKVVSGDLGLPTNTLACPIANPADSNFRALLLFGGTRIEGQVESRLKLLEDVLGAARPTTVAKKGLAVESHENLVKALSNLNFKRLFDYDLANLAEIVNGLEETKEQLSLAMKPKFHAVSEYIMKKRVRK